MVREVGTPVARPVRRRSAKPSAARLPPPPPIHHEPTHEIETDQPVGFWYRFAASCIDLSILGTVAALALPVVLALTGLPPGLPEALRQLPRHLLQPFDLAPLGDALLPVLIAALAAWVVFNWLYEALLTGSRFGGTLGKTWLDMKVVRPDGSPVGFVRASLRHFAKYLSWAPLMLGCILAAVHPRKRSLHDLIAGTVVVYRP